MANELQQLINDAFAQSNALDSSLAPLLSSAEKAWKSAGETTARHLFLVIRNSQRRSLEQLLQRPDVRDVIRVPYLDAARATERAVQRAWDQGIELGIEAANRDLQVLGYDAVDTKGLHIDTSVLERLKRDVNDNASRTRMCCVMKRSHQEITIAQKT